MGRAMGRAKDDQRPHKKSKQCKKCRRTSQNPPKTAKSFKAMQKLPKNHPSEQFRPILGRAGQNGPELGAQSQKCPGSVPEVSRECPGVGIGAPKCRKKTKNSYFGPPKTSFGRARTISGPTRTFSGQLGPFWASFDLFGRARTFSGCVCPKLEEVEVRGEEGGAAEAAARMDYGRRCRFLARCACHGCPASVSATTDPARSEIGRAHV